MSDVFYIILIVYVLWRIFGGKVKTNVYHHHYSSTKKDGEVTVGGTSKANQSPDASQGEYVDFEELPSGNQDKSH